MNIFLVSSDPYECAITLDDLRLNKMILETAQMLCCAYRYYFPDLAKENEDILYKNTHENHPCNIWLRKDIHNYYWTLELFNALTVEKYYRTQVRHMSWVKLYGLLYEPVANFESAGNNYMDIAFDFNCSNVYPSKNVFKDYQNCLENKWQNDSRPPKWTKRSKPQWDEEGTRYEIF